MSTFAVQGGEATHTGTGLKLTVRRAAYWLSLAFVFMVPWENSVALTSLGSLTRAMGLLVAAAWLCSVLLAGRFRKPRIFHLAALFFVALNVISLGWTVAPEDTVQLAKTYLQLSLMVYMLWDLYTEPVSVRQALQAYVFGAYVAIGSTVANYLAGHAFAALGPQRFAAAGSDPNELGLVLALGIPFAWHMGVSTGSSGARGIVRLLNFAYIPAACFAILLTASRAAFISALPALIFVLASLTRLKVTTRLLVFCGVVAALLVLRPFIPEASLARLGTSGSSIQGFDLGGRGDIWRSATRIVAEHPVWGVGAGAFPVAATEVRGVVHNSFLSVLTETGIVGLLLFVVVLIAAADAALNQPKGMFWLWLTLLLVWGIGASTLTWEHSKPTWLLLGLLVTSGGLHRWQTNPADYRQQSQLMEPA